MAGRNAKGYAAYSARTRRLARAVARAVDGAAVAACALALSAAALLGGPWWTAAYLVCSAVTLSVYAYDKRAARLNGDKQGWRRADGTFAPAPAGAQRRRVSEAALQWLALLAGWPGALAGQLFHKSSWQRKRSFKLVTWGIAALHLLFWNLTALSAWLVPADNPTRWWLDGAALLLLGVYLTRARRA